MYNASGDRIRNKEIFFKTTKNKENSFCIVCWIRIPGLKVFEEKLGI